MKKNSLILAAMLIYLSGFAKDTLQIKQWAVAKPITIKQAFLNDTINIFGAKADDKYLLKTTVSQSAYKNSISISNTDNNGYANLAVTSGNDAVIIPLSFTITPPSYTKGELIITTPHMFEIYVDGVKLTEKTSVEKDAKKTTVSVKMQPQTHYVTIKYLLPSRSDSTPNIKAELVSDNANIQLAANPTKRLFALTDVMQGERPSRVSVSPDGKYIMYASTIQMVKNKTKTLYKIQDYNTGKLVLSSEDKGWSWLPKGSRLYYTIDTEKGKNLRIFDLATMQESVIVESLPDGYFYWSPDETYLIFAVSDKSPENKTGVNQILTPQDRIANWRNRSFLSRFDLKTETMQSLTFGYRSTYLSAISPDSKYIVFGTSKNNYTERPFSLSSYYLMNLETMKVDTLWKDIKYGYPVTFSPDGKQLLLAGGPESFNNIGRDPKIKDIPNSYDTQTYIYDLASKNIKAITLNFNPSIKSSMWSKVDNNIYFTTDDEDRTTCYRYVVKSNKFEKLPFTVDVVQQFSMATDVLKAAYIGQSVSYPAQLYKADLKTGQSTLLYNPTKSRMDEIELGKVEDWNFKSRNGDEISGRYYLPYNFDPAKKYPVIVYYYGGTTPVTRTFDGRYPFHLYASMGYVVYVLQPAGTIGFGQQFSAWHVNAWGERTADDIIEGTKKFCDAHNFVDKSKIGCIGASYGGFMTMYLQTRTDIFAAAISHAGISDVTSYWGEGYWGYSYNAVAASDSYPWNNRKVFVDQSPLFSADKVKTPILLLHGAVDTNVPVGESVQMFTALKLLGKPVELITFDKEDHHIIDTDMRIAWQNSIFAWFAKWLHNDNTWWSELYPEKNL